MSRKLRLVFCTKVTDCLYGMFDRIQLATMRKIDILHSSMH